MTIADPVAPAAAVKASSFSVAARLGIVLFVFAAASPVMFEVGGMLLNSHRAMMLILIAPLFFAWASGRAPGGILMVDMLLIASVLWMLAALLANHSFQRVFVFWFSQAIETIGPYLLARLLIRDTASFLFYTRTFVYTILFLLPFAALEAVTGNTFLVNLFDKIPGMRVPLNVGYGERLNLTRAQVTFEHPILYGAFCVIPLALAWIALRADPRVTATGRVLRSGLITAATFFSVSSGPLGAAMVQFGLLAWDRVLEQVKARWRIFAGLFATGYILVDLLSNRAPFVVLVSYATFSTSTAYNRVLIWRYGTDDVMSNPLFGIGLNDWTRPWWMLPSVDNFWLLWAMRYGLVGFILFAGALLLIMYAISKRDFSADPVLSLCRKGYLISFVGIATALATVAFWGGTYAMFLFFIGSGVWMIGAEAGQGDADQTPDAVPPPSRYTRYPAKADTPPVRRRSTRDRKTGQQSAQAVEPPSTVRTVPVTRAPSGPRR